MFAFRRIDSDQVGPIFHRRQRCREAIKFRSPSDLVTSAWLIAQLWRLIEHDRLFENNCFGHAFCSFQLLVGSFTVLGTHRFSRNIDHEPSGLTGRIDRPLRRAPVGVVFAGEDLISDGSSSSNACVSKCTWERGDWRRRFGGAAAVPAAGFSQWNHASATDPPLGQRRLPRDPGHGSSFRGAKVRLFIPSS